MDMTVEASKLNQRETFRWLFLIAALYDGILGIVFFFFNGPILDTLGVDAPANRSYVHLAAGLIAVQGLGFYFVWRDMLRNVDLVKVGVVYKLVYTVVAVYYVIRGELVHPIFGWFAFIDVLFLIGFLWFLQSAKATSFGQPRAAQLPGER